MGTQPISKEPIIRIYDRKFRLTSPTTPGIVVIVKPRRLRVLLVDDDVLVRLAIDRQLEALGCDVLSVDKGREAITLLEKGMRFDVLVTDLNLPDVDGRSVAWTAAAFSPRMRMVFMSGSAPGEPLEPADAPFLLKPFSTTALANAIAGAIPLDPPLRPRRR